MNKPLPHNIEAEQAVLGGCLLYPRYIPPVQKIISPDDMYREAHKYICEALFDLKKDTDFISVCDYLQERSLLEKAGGHDYITSLAEGVSTGAGSERWAHIIKKHSDRRKLYEKEEWDKFQKATLEALDK